LAYGPAGRERHQRLHAVALELAWLGASEAALLLPRAVIGYWLW